MPFLNATTLATKVRGVAGAQDVLLFVFLHPDALAGVGVDNMGRVNLHFENGPSRHIGHLLPIYATCFGMLLPLEWTVTGGKPIPEIVSQHGILHQRFGLNLVLRVLDPTGHASGRTETRSAYAVH